MEKTIKSIKGYKFITSEMKSNKTRDNKNKLDIFNLIIVIGLALIIIVFLFIRNFNEGCAECILSLAVGAGIWLVSAIKSINLARQKNMDVNVALYLSFIFGFIAWIIYFIWPKKKVVK